MLAVHAPAQHCFRDTMGAPTLLGATRPVGSLLFALETDDAFQARHPADAQPDLVAITAARLKEFLRPVGAFAQQLLKDVRRYKRAHRLEKQRRHSPAGSDEDEGAQDVDVVELAAHLSELGYAVGVRSALGGIKHMGSNAAPGSCFRNLRHEFLFVRCEQPGEGEGLEFFVEPLFRDQFNIPQPTPSYSTLLASVPEEFVGTSSRLKPVVELLCGEMALSFEARGLCVPPWRRPAAMLSKWIPAKVMDRSPSLTTPPAAAMLLPPPQPEPLPAAAAAPPQPLQPPPPAPTSPDRELKLAAQQLAALALHNQRQASPTQQQQPTLLGALQPPPPLPPVQESPEQQQPHGVSTTLNAPAAAGPAAPPPLHAGAALAPPPQHGAAAAVAGGGQPPAGLRSDTTALVAAAAEKLLLRAPPRAFSSHMDGAGAAAAQQHHQVLGGASPPTHAEHAGGASPPAAHLNRLGAAFARHSEPFMRHSTGMDQGPASASRLTSGRLTTAGGRPAQPVSLLSAQLQAANGSSCPSSPLASMGGGGALPLPPAALVPLLQPPPPLLAPAGLAGLKQQQQLPQPVVVGTPRPLVAAAAAAPGVVQQLQRQAPRAPGLQQQQEPAAPAALLLPALLGAGAGDTSAVARWLQQQPSLWEQTMAAPAVHAPPAAQTTPDAAPPALPATLAALLDRVAAAQPHGNLRPALAGAAAAAATARSSTDGMAPGRISIDAPAATTGAAGSGSGAVPSAWAEEGVAKRPEPQPQPHGTRRPQLSKLPAALAEAGGGAAPRHGSAPLPAWPGAPVIHKVRPHGPAQRREEQLPPQQQGQHRGAAAVAEGGARGDARPAPHAGSCGSSSGSSSSSGYTSG